MLKIILFNPHPHISLLREFLGYKICTSRECDVIEDNSEYLKSLDPKNWKTNDHYAVLNLKQARYKASDEMVRENYRRLVLKHHPDKRRGHGEDVKDYSHDYFTCITQAYEILGNPSKRVAYDGVDVIAIDESIPSISEVNTDFFGSLEPKFRENARWSAIQPVPQLGNMNTPIHRVHEFYDFWFEFKTTRDFSFLDEEDKDQGEDRETRRFIERKNRTERALKKTEENRRIRKLVDLARDNDPRLLAVIKATKEAKEKKQQERLLKIQLRKEAEEERLKAEAIAAEAAFAAGEEQRRLETERFRKEKGASKLLAKRAKKRLRKFCVEHCDHFISAALAEQPSTHPDDIKVKTLQDMDILFQLLSISELTDLTDQLEATKTREESYEIWKSEVYNLKKKIEPPIIEQRVKKTDAAHGSSFSNWSNERIQVLIKAVNIFPAGTGKRWEVIAAYVNQHSNDLFVTANDALKMAKTLRNNDESLKKQINTKAYDNFVSSVRTQEPVMNVTITNNIEAEATRLWTQTEQRALEQALRQNNTAVDSNHVSDRWQRIADFVGTRSRNECMMRYKELVEQVRLKRNAIAAAGVASTK